jgi:hypothetical protein
VRDKGHEKGQHVGLDWGKGKRDGEGWEGKRPSKRRKVEESGRTLVDTKEKDVWAALDELDPDFDDLNTRVVPY